MRSLTVALMVALGGSPVLAGQGQPAVGPQFEVVSVKQNTLGEQPSNNWQLRANGLDYHNSQVLQLVKAAWGDFSMRVEGDPGWLSTDRYDVVTRYPEGTTSADRNLMLRNLLIDRFELAAHLETREVPMYSLVVARADGRLGPQMLPPVAECQPSGRANPPSTCRQGGGPGLLHFDYLTMTNLTRTLSSMGAVGRPVVNNSKLTGAYKVDLAFAPPQPPAADAAPPDAPSIFTALQEQLGLRLEDIRGPVQVLVIDRIERPTPD